MLIPISEYATLHGKAAISVRNMARRGRFQTALQIGRNWVIDSEEPYPTDARVTSGQYINWRKKRAEEAPRRSDDPDSGT